MKPLYVLGWLSCGATLDTIARLPDNWDSYGGVPIDPRAIATARAMTKRPPAIVPTSDGGIQLEWHGDGVDVEVRIDPRGLICWEEE